jgi:hypothetical protein
MTIDSAPSRMHGLLAFFVYLVRAFFGRSHEGNWGKRQSEPPLSEIFADAVIDE